MARTIWALAVASVVALATLAFVEPAAAKLLRCSRCGTVLHVAPIFYDHDVARPDAPAGTIVGGSLSSGWFGDPHGGVVAARATGGLVGRNMGKGNYRGGTVGRRVELKLDRGGHAIIEVHGEMRIYRGDRVRIMPDSLVILD